MRILTSFAAAIIGCSVLPAYAVPIYGGPTYDSATHTGYVKQDVSVKSAGNGVAVGRVLGPLGYRAIVWDTTNPPRELENLGNNSDGITDTIAISINAATEIISGYSIKYESNIDKGLRATRWDTAGHITELAPLYQNLSGYAYSQALTTNSAGITVGSSTKFVNNTSLGSRPVMWDAAGNATELEILAPADQDSNSYVVGINSAGTMVGYSQGITDRLIVDQKSRPVKWNSVGQITQLQMPDGISAPVGIATNVNDGGIIIGAVLEYELSQFRREHAVQWGADGTVLKLATLTDNIGSTHAGAINAAGTIAGYADKFEADVYLGRRAVRWDNTGNITELDHLGTHSSGYAETFTYAINDHGLIVGFADTYDISAGSSRRAAAWNTDGSITDLNTLLSSFDALYWTLTEARAISNSNWVTGIGMYHPTGMESEASYLRMFMLQVPEPASAALLAFAGIALQRRHRNAR